MKKFIIVIVFVFLIAILISFNYLLWDREKQLENYQDLSNSKNLSIDTLGEKISTLDNLNKELNGKVDALTKGNNELKENVTALSEENLTVKQDILAKNELVLLLKDNLNVEPLETVIKKWVEAVNSKNYNAAQELISKTSTDQILMNPEIFKSAYQSELRAISLKSAKIYTELIDDEHIGKIQFQVVLQADKPEQDEKNGVTPEKLYKNGENQKYFTMEYDSQSKEWRISQISDAP